ncbi:hypothetical protein [Microbacterium sp. ZW T5_56]|uniref:hypothetical protein n=1 Tax=Microbacterium sp. ZW T5_56 TaxID=3378081 RepID=UPI0038546CBA
MVDARYERIIGDWTGTDEFVDGSGAASGILSIAPGPGGVVIDYVRRAGGHDLAAHAVIAGGGLWWFDSDGATPAQPGEAGWQDDMLVLDREHEGVRQVLGLIARADRIDLHLATAASGDGLAPVMSGSYSRRTLS